MLRKINKEGAVLSSNSDKEIKGILKKHSDNNQIAWSVGLLFLFINNFWT